MPPGGTDQSRCDRIEHARTVNENPVGLAEKAHCKRKAIPARPPAALPRRDSSIDAFGGAENAPEPLRASGAAGGNLTTVYNLAYLLYTFNQGVAILSAFAVAFGVYIAIFEWRLLQQLRPDTANR